MIRWFRGVAVVEAVSYLMLLAASVAKHVFGVHGLVETIGPVHGVIFLVYLGLALAVRRPLGWDPATTDHRGHRRRGAPGRARWSSGGSPTRQRKLRSRRLLVTTNTLEAAMAAPASMGLARPAAASGRAATL